MELFLLKTQETMKQKKVDHFKNMLGEQQSIFFKNENLNKFSAVKVERSKENNALININFYIRKEE